ncbi:MAG: hypothetical protein WDW38_008586 [Sanguina aurantia]
MHVMQVSLCASQLFTECEQIAFELLWVHYDSFAAPRLLTHVAESSSSYTHRHGSSAQGFLQAVGLHTAQQAPISTNLCTCT